METKVTKNQFFFFMLLAVVVVASVPTKGFGASMQLEWYPSSDADVAGYKVYSQTQPFQGSEVPEGAVYALDTSTSSATLDGLDPGLTYYFAVTAYNTAGTESDYSDTKVLMESIPPTVNIDSQSGALSGVVSIAATASDNVGVTKLELYADNELQTVTSAQPWSFRWDTSALPAGYYTLFAKAYDAAGNVGQSTNVVVTIAGDTTPPTATLSYSGDGATVTGNVIIAASATDNIGVTRIEVYDNGILVSAGNDTSLSYNWNSLLAANGLHQLMVKAYDAAGNVGTTTASLAVVNDTAAPTVSIASPYAGGLLSGSASVVANAIDDIGVSIVEFYVNGALQATSTSAPYSFTWNTAALANGTYTLNAKAYDAAGHVGVSANTTITVLNDTTAPTVSFLAPASNYVYGNKISISASATDDVGVTRMELYVDNVLKYSTTSSSLNTSSNMSMGVHTITVKAYDAANNVKVASKTVNRFN